MGKVTPLCMIAFLLLSSLTYASATRPGPFHDVTPVKIQHMVRSLINFLKKINLGFLFWLLSELMNCKFITIFIYLRVICFCSELHSR